MGTAGQSITLANSIIGVGILAMPFCFQQCGVLLATLILLSMGLVSRLCCYFLLKSALLARRRNFEFLAFHVFGPAGKLAVEMGIIGFLMGTCIAYFVVVGDLGPQIIAKLLNINQSDILRTSIMVIVSLVCVLPLGLLRNVDSLNNVSAATICFYFCLAIKVIAEAASQLLAGDWHTKMAMWKPSGVLQCVPIFSMALFCQTQLFEIFESLPTLSLEKMNLVTKNAINICTAVYFTLGVFGYIAFCSQNISGNILMSLSPTMASDVIKLGFVMSLAFSFPLIIFPCRASLYSFLYKKVHSAHHDHIINHSIPETTFRCITVAIVVVALVISLLIPNIELVLGLLGSTIGVLICVVFPAACFVNVTFKNTNERILAKATLILGLVILVLGTYGNLQAAEMKLDRYDDKITQERIDKIVEDFFEKRDDGMKMAVNGDEKIVPQEPINIELEKDSEVQPPNPVPPESQSNEKQQAVKNGIEQTNIKSPSIINGEKLIPIVEKVDKILGSHPKNLKNKLKEANISNGKIEISENKKPNEETVDTQKVDKTQEKIDMMKQQQLVETIKQHGEEQKELIKEQKEILDEIIKTKKELQLNKKKEIDGNVAKKIAVESIQKIANVAIQSLNGVSDKPGEIEKGKEPLEKTANEAVQEIAKKAVETIEAIKVANAPIVKQVNVQNNIQPPLNNDLSKQNAQFINTNQQANINNMPNNQPIDLKQEKSVVVPVLDLPHAEALVQNNNIEITQNGNNNVVVGENSNLPPVNEINSNGLNVNNENSQIQHVKHQETPQKSQPREGVNKEHSHSPDEPKSYKQGEDSQKTIQMAKNVVEHIPVPVVLKGNSRLNQNPQPPIVKEILKDAESANVQANGAHNNLGLLNPSRQKREVVDCTQTMSLGPQDREICKTLLGPHLKQEFLPQNVEINDLGLPKHLPLVDTMIHHVRSLKSFEENRTRR